MTRGGRFSPDGRWLLYSSAEAESRQSMCSDSRSWVAGTGFHRTVGSIRRGPPLFVRPIAMIGTSLGPYKIIEPLGAGWHGRGVSRRRHPPGPQGFSTSSDLPQVFGPLRNSLNRC